jgi:hypothetical protein
MSKKLEQVLEYLIAGKQAQAKELLHQVFIEKARMIHEDIMSHDDVEEDDCIPGDEGEDWMKDITGKHDKHLKNMSDDIDAEETMSEDDGDDIDDNTEMPGGDEMGGDTDIEDDGMIDPDGSDLDISDEAGDDEMGGMGDDMGGDAPGGMGKIEDTIGDLEDILDELKAEFERLESGDGDVSDELGGDDMGGDETSDDELGGDDMSGDDMSGDETSHEDMGSDDMSGDETNDEDMDESWLDEDWDELSEAIELEKVKVEMGGEVGAGKFNPGDANSKSKSPVPTSQTSRMGAAPVKINSKDHSNYNKETPPTSKDMGLSNRRKTAETGMSKVSKEGDKSAALNKTESEFSIGSTGKNSPLSKAPRK